MMRRAPTHAIPSHGPPLPGPGQVSNITNSNDFISKDSRVFVGNLNTFVLSKEDVDAIFRHYGIVTGISMHKGYAFVQFSHPGEARRAVGFESGQVYAGQALDLNIVSEPKQRAPQKRNSGPPLNDRSGVKEEESEEEAESEEAQDRSSDSDTDWTEAKHTQDRHPPMQTSPVLPPAAKRPRQDSNPSLQRSNLVTLANSGKNPVVTKTRPSQRPVPYSSASRVAAASVKRATATVTKAVSNATRASVSATSVAPTTDVLICGVCKMQFTSLHSLAQHKKIPCHLRASCQCQTNPPKQPDDKEPIELDCATCDARFDSAWALCQHAQEEHSVAIFKTKDNSYSPASAAKTLKADKASEDKNSKLGGEEDAKITAVKKGVWSNPCQNGGTCKPHWNGYVCNTGYTGDHCQTAPLRNRSRSPTPDRPDTPALEVTADEHGILCMAGFPTEVARPLSIPNSSALSQPGSPYSGITEDTPGTNMTCPRGVVQQKAALQVHHRLLALQTCHQLAKRHLRGEGLLHKTPRKSFTLNIFLFLFN